MLPTLLPTEHSPNLSIFVMKNLFYAILAKNQPTSIVY